MEKQPEIALECKNIKKSFFGNEVLHDVSIQLKKGTILALVGENGAGKSTLINIISGNLKADSGEIIFKGEKSRIRNPHQAREEGIAVVHQLLSLVPELSIAENIFLGQENKFGKLFINNKQMHTLAHQELTQNTELSLDVYKVVALLSPAEKQMVEIMKAWVNRPSIMILDEPTSSLSVTEVHHFFKLVERLKNQGTAIIFITHRMDEIFEICDEVVVLRDGHITKQSLVRDITKDQVIGAMVGREKNSELFPARMEQKSDRVVLSLSGAGNKYQNIQDLNFQLYEGEIVGIAGLEGHGQRGFARALFGVDGFTEGIMKLYDKPVYITSPKQAMKHGIAYIPDDRPEEGIIKDMSVSNNLVLATLKSISSAGIVSKKKLSAAVQDGIKRLEIKTQSLMTLISHLSGGNQQKVIFSKWLRTAPTVLLLNQPTQGIDVKTKEEIYKLLRNFASQGGSVILVSNDMLELMGISDRIVVMYEGRIVGELDGATATEEMIMTLSSGEAPQKASN